MKKISAISLILFFCACAKVLIPTDADASRAAVKYPGTTLAELSEGKVIYEDHCNACHPYKKPSSRTEEQWKEIVPKMVKKANKKAGREEIDAKEQEQLLKYILVMREAAK